MKKFSPGPLSMVAAMSCSLAVIGCSSDDWADESAEAVTSSLASDPCHPAYLTGTPRASSNPSTVPQAFDGSTRSGGWQAATTGTEWYEVDLGGERRLDGFLIAWSLPSSDFDVQWKDAAGAWHAIRTYTSISSPDTIFEAVDLNVRTRYVRVFSRRSSSSTQGVILSEVELSGDDSSGCSSTYRIDSVHSGRSLDMTGWSRADGGRLQQWSYHGGNNQRWVATLKSARRVVERDIQPEYEIRSLHSGKCLDIDGPSTENLAAIHQWTCYDGLLSQRFFIEDEGAGEVSIRSAYSRKCLDVDAWGTTDGSKLIQWDCHGGANQRWRFRQP